MQAAELEPLGHLHLLGVAGHLLERVLARMIHGRRGRHGRGQEGLHSIGLEAVPLEPERELQHVFFGRAGVGRDEVGDQILLLAGLGGVLLEEPFELVVGAHAGLHHLRQRPLCQVLRRNLEVAAHMVGHELLHVARVFDG